MKKLLSIFFTLVVFALGAKAQDIPDEERGRIAFDQQQVVLDTCYYKVDTVITQNYHFRNVGLSPLTIASYNAGCPCIQVELPEGPVAPGAEADIVVHFTPHYPGAFRHTIGMATDGAPRVRYIVLSVVLLDPKNR